MAIKILPSLSFLGGLILLTFSSYLAANENTSHTIARLLIAEIALSRDMPKIALEHYLKASQATTDPKIAAYATQLAVRTADIQTAVRPATLWAQKAPTDLEAQMTVIALQLRLGHISQSLPYLIQMTKISPEGADQHFMVLYRSLSEERDKQSVLEALTLLDEQRPNQPFSSIALSDIYLQQQNYSKALYFSKKAIQIAPDASNAVIIHGECLRQTSDLPTALTFLESHLEKTPNNPYIRYYLGELYFYHHELDKAKQQFEQLAQNPQTPPEMLLQLTNLSMQQEWFKLAQNTLQTVEKNPEYEGSARYFLGRLAEAEKSPEKAIQWYTRVYEGPFQVLSRIRAAILLLESQKEPHQALSVLESATPETLGDFKRLSLTRIQILVSMQEYSAALHTANQGLKLIENDSDLLVARNFIQEKLNNTAIKP